MQEAGDTSPVIRFEGFTLDVAQRSLSLAGRPVELRPKSFDVLVFLAQAAGRAVPKDELLLAVWPGVIVTEESLTRCVSDVRHALRDGDQRIIKTLPRFGYRFVAPMSREATATDSATVEEPPHIEIPAHRLDRVWHLARHPRWAWALMFLIVVGAGLAALRVADVGSLRTASHVAHELSIVVLPLTSRNGDPAQDYLAEAVAEEITVDLSRIPGSIVIARSSADSYRGRGVDARQVGRDLGVRYVLEGSLDRLDDRVQLSLQLVDAASGRALWAERFDGQLGDLSRLHRQVTGTVAQSLHLRLVEAESARAGQRRSINVGAQDLALQAWATLRKRTPESVALAREKLQVAVVLDPQSALAWSLLAETYAADVGFRSLHLRGASRDQWLQRAAEAADRAYALDSNHLNAVGARATVLSLQARSEEALAMLERQIALNRNDATAWYRLSYTYATLGRAEEAITAGHEAIRLSPRDAQLCGFYVVIAAAHLHLGEDRKALEWARKSALERPDFSVAHSWMASAAAHLGDATTAHAALAEFRHLQPQYTIGSFRAEGLCANAICRSQRERFYAGLKEAGLPE
jgi:TolB-like protein/DNA-binding winged helix-turn-helix (wHTH) protein